jgi:hypothetical protein
MFNKVKINRPDTAILNSELQNKTTCLFIISGHPGILSGMQATT